LTKNKDKTMQDLHIHMFPGRMDTPEEFKQKTMAAGVTGGNVLGMYPETFGKEDGEDQRWGARLDAVLTRSCLLLSRLYSAK
jgi:hypothetical protein